MKWFSLFAIAASFLCSAGFANSKENSCLKAKLHMEEVYRATTSLFWADGEGSTVQYGIPLPLGTPMTFEGFSLVNNSHSIKAKHSGLYAMILNLYLEGIGDNLLAVVQFSPDEGQSWTDFASAPITIGQSESNFSLDLCRAGELRVVIRGDFAELFMPPNKEVLKVKIFSACDK